MRTMLAAMQEHTKYRPSADNALMRWVVRHAAWLIPRFRGSEIQSPFYRAMGGPYRGKLVELGETVLAHLPEVGKRSGNPAPKLADRWKSRVWLGKSDLTDEHLVRTDDATSSSSRGEKRTETQENVFVKRRLMAKSPKRPTTLVPPPEDPVKRRLLKKTDMRNDESVMNVDENLLNVVSILTKDENIPEANSNEDNEMPKFKVLDDYEEMMKGRQKELN